MCSGSRRDLTLSRPGPAHNTKNKIYEFTKSTDQSKLWCLYFTEGRLFRLYWVSTLTSEKPVYPWTVSLQVVRILTLLTVEKYSPRFSLAFEKHHPYRIQLIRPWNPLISQSLDYDPHLTKIKVILFWFFSREFQSPNVGCVEHKDSYLR